MVSSGLIIRTELYILEHLSMKFYCIVGFYLHESGLLGASPDATSDECTVEIKCPYTHRMSTDLKKSLMLPEPRRGRGRGCGPLTQPQRFDRYFVNYNKERQTWVLNKQHPY